MKVWTEQEIEAIHFCIGRCTMVLHRHSDDDDDEEEEEEDDGL
jgi:hypothetical protein